MAKSWAWTWGRWPMKPKMRHLLPNLGIYRTWKGLRLSGKWPLFGTKLWEQNMICMSELNQVSSPQNFQRLLNAMPRYQELLWLPQGFLHKQTLQLIFAISQSSGCMAHRINPSLLVQFPLKCPKWTGNAIELRQWSCFILEVGTLSSWIKLN